MKNGDGYASHALFMVVVFVDDDDDVIGEMG